MVCVSQRGIVNCIAELFEGQQLLYIMHERLCSRTCGVRITASCLSNFVTDRIPARVINR